MSERMIKVTLKDSAQQKEKIVLLRELKISHTEQAAQDVSHRANGDANLMQLFMQKSLLKLLLHSINDKVVPANDKEQMDDLFSVKEYSSLLKVIAKLNGSEEKEVDPKIDFVSIGDK